MIGNGRKLIDGPLFENRKFLLPKDGKGHFIRRIMGIVKLLHIRPNGSILSISKSFQIAHREFREGVLWIRGFSPYLSNSSGIFLDFHAVFGVHRISFTLHEVRVEFRSDEKLGESIQCRLEVVLFYGEMIRRVFLRGTGI